MSESSFRGHPIIVKNGDWIYQDSGQKVHLLPDRPCGYCGKANTPEGHDGCLGTLPNVMNACCGHGKISEAYVQYFDGSRESILAHKESE